MSCPYAEYNNIENNNIENMSNTENMCNDVYNNTEDNNREDMFNTEYNREDNNREDMSLLEDNNMYNVYYNREDMSNTEEVKATETVNRTMTDTTDRAITEAVNRAMAEAAKITEATKATETTKATDTKETDTKKTIFEQIYIELTQIKREYPIGVGFLIAVFVILCVLIPFIMIYRSKLKTIGKTFINNNYKKFYKY